MRSSPRFIPVFLGLLVVAFAIAGYGQQSGDPEAYTAVANGQAGLSSLKPAVDVTSTQGGVITIGSNFVFDADTGALVSGGVGQASVNTAAGIGGGNDDQLVMGFVRPTPKGGNLPGLDTLATFDGAFFAQAGPSST